MSTRTDTEIQDFLAGLRRNPADLPAAEVDEIILDLQPQLAAIADELGADLSPATLADRLGTPDAYAGELRSAMELPEPGPREPGTGQARRALWVLVVTAVAGGCGGFLSARPITIDPRPVPLAVAVAQRPARLLGGRRRDQGDGAAAGAYLGEPPLALIGRGLDAFR